MSVRVRLFAAAREAAGTAETQVAPGPLPALLGALVERYGPRFAACLEVATVLVDGDATPRAGDREVADGSEIAILPPVSGGAGPHP